MLTEKDYCDYDTCVALEELGFVGESQYFYRTKESPLKKALSNQILTIRTARALDLTLGIHLWDAQKWLRKERNLHIEVGYNPSLPWYYYHVCDSQEKIAEGEAFPSYEDALQTAIYMAVEYLKEEK